MNFLTLVQELHRESGSGGTAPTTLSGLRGENLRLKKWVEQGDTISKSVYRPPKTSGDIDPVKCRDQLTTKLKSSFPPTGPMLNFWSAVYGF